MPIMIIEKPITAEFAEIKNQITKQISTLENAVVNPPADLIK